MNATQAPIALRPRDAAKALQISPRHLWQLTADGLIPCVRLGTGKRKTVLYFREALESLLRQEAVSNGSGDSVQP